MKFTRLMPLLRTRNLEQTVAFYRDRLGFECTQQSSDWAFVERDDITLMIALSPMRTNLSIDHASRALSIFRPTMSINSGVR
jgi:catechol 2,3-dioxygenase-like lactoylglutathione lyase family enzyme